MKKLIWKELRENAGWFVFGAALVSIAFIINLMPKRELHNPAHVLQEVFQVTHICVAGLVGLAIGLFQSLAENHRDQFAFLVHRPVSRRRIFAGKVVGGLLGYFLAVGIPYALAILWIMRPESSPIVFAPSMLLPGLVDSLGGVLTYFSGLLIGTRQVRWHGSRMLPVVLAAGGLIGMSQIPSLSGALGLWGVGLVLLAGGAWLAFEAGGDDQRLRGRWRILLTGSLVPGVVVLLMLASLVLSAVWPRESIGWNQYYRLDREGEIYLVEYTPGRTRVFDLRGKEHHESPNGTWQNIDEFWAQHMNGHAISLPTDKPRFRAIHDSYRALARHFQYSAVGTHNIWYYSPRFRRLLVYDREERILRGGIGPGGFSETIDSADKFGPSRPSIAEFSGRLVLGQGVEMYLIDINQFEIERFEPGVPDGEKFGVAVVSLSVADGNNVMSRQHLIVSSSDQLLVYDQQLKQRVKLSVKPDGRRYVHLAHLWNSDEWLMWMHRRRITERDGYVRRFAADGTLLHEQELPKLKDYRLRFVDSDAVAAGLVSPPLTAVGFLLDERFGGRNTPLLDPWSLREKHYRKWYLPALVSQILLVILLVMILQWSRWLRGEARWWALLGGVLFGPAAPIVMAILGGRPLREPCHECGDQRPLNETDCPGCGQPFAQPESDGTEIFAELQRVERSPSL